MMKNLLNAFHDVVHALLHIILIPVVVTLKAMVAGLTHLLTEVEKV